MKSSSLAALFLLVVLSTQVSADTTETLVGEVFFGPATGETGSGSFTYDETLLTGVGTETIGVLDGLTLEFTFVGKTFFETDDTDYDSFPVLSFEDGSIVSLDFVVTDGDGVGTEIDDPRFNEFSTFFLDFDPTTGGYFAEIATFMVPEPQAAALALVCLAAICRRSLRS